MGNNLLDSVLVPVVGAAVIVRVTETTLGQPPRGRKKSKKRVTEKCATKRRAAGKCAATKHTAGTGSKSHVTKKKRKS